jgi:hypothetical protein
MADIAVGRPWKASLHQAHAVPAVFFNIGKIALVRVYCPIALNERRDFVLRVDGPRYSTPRYRKGLEKITALTKLLIA